LGVLHGLGAFTRSRSRATDLNHGPRRLFALDDLRDARPGIYAWDLLIMVGSSDSGRLRSKDDIQGSRVERVHVGLCEYVSRRIVVSGVTCTTSQGCGG
jgi:hypothetical protein